jgi:hypothetical protein
MGPSRNESEAALGGVDAELKRPVTELAMVRDVRASAS